ncbi:MAG: peptide deformylase [Peptococcaceae bacterium]|nr:MAG: peptide deformylase [Peptococcaceae bacterium]
MAVYKIVEIGASVLKEKAKAVPKITSNIHKLLDNMADTMYGSNGVGLAAPQIGVSKRIIVAHSREGLIELINPEIVRAAGEDVDVEGCLSVPGIYGDVRRAYTVEVIGLNRQGETVQVGAEGFLARILQHEIDHLEGILFVEKAANVRKSEKSIALNQDD